MFAGTDRTKTSTEHKNFERKNDLAQFGGRFAEARVRSQFLTFPFAS